jgi:DNA polymerase III delta subunit
MQLKLAIFESPGTKYKARAIYTESDAKYTTFVRVTDWVTVDFPLLADEYTVPERLKLLREKVERLRHDADKDVFEVEQDIRELSAFTPDKTLTADEVRA